MYCFIKGTQKCTKLFLTQLCPFYLVFVSVSAVLQWRFALLCTTNVPFKKLLLIINYLRVEYTRKKVNFLLIGAKLG